MIEPVSSKDFRFLDLREVLPASASETFSWSKVGFDSDARPATRPSSSSSSATWGTKCCTSVASPSESSSETDCDFRPTRARDFSPQSPSPSSRCRSFRCRCCCRHWRRRIELSCDRRMRERRLRWSEVLEILLFPFSPMKMFDFCFTFAKVTFYSLLFRFWWAVENWTRERNGTKWRKRKGVNVKCALVEQLRRSFNFSKIKNNFKFWFFSACHSNIYLNESKTFNLSKQT